MIKPLKEYKVAIPYLTVPFSPVSFLSLMKYLKTVIKDFFWLQFSVKLGLKKIPIINVDHPLDKKVPFRPDKIDDYLDFINFWIRPMSLLVAKIGRKKAIPYCAKYLQCIEKAYATAAEIYRIRMTTTNRPNYKESSGFRTLHILDPHYLCVPSLHIAIVVLAWNFYGKVFNEIELPEDEKKFYLNEIYLGAKNIAETVLYVKQHSVNCIPAALYMVTCIFPDTFPIETATNFIEDLFSDAHDVKKTDKIAIRTHIEMIYEQFVLEGCQEDDWKVPVLRWLYQYKACE